LQEKRDENARLTCTLAEAEAELNDRIYRLFNPTADEIKLLQKEVEGEPYRDSLARVFVDVEDTAENRQFFVRLKGRLKSRFQQKDIWLTDLPD
jgi:hypothetical protein